MRWILCKLSGHREVGDGGGFYCFTCARCGRPVWRLTVDYDALIRADAAINLGDAAGADRIRREAIGKR